MAWMQYGAHPYEIGYTELHPDVDYIDIAHSLAQINRYNGHAIVPYSVAQHSVFVSELLDIDPLIAMYGLVHDVAETVTGDITWPMKQAFSEAARRELDEITKAAEIALFSRLGVPYPMPPDIAKLVKRADWNAAATEKRDVMPGCLRHWDMLKHSPSHRGVWGSENWREDSRRWCERYRELAAHLGIGIDYHGKGMDDE